jgi:hypothetical protein
MHASHEHNIVRNKSEKYSGYSIIIHFFEGQQSDTGISSQKNDYF